MTDRPDMSDIEDVLSSIRRLVTEDGAVSGPVHTPSETVRKAGTAPLRKRAEALVLTPEQRVAEHRSSRFRASDAQTPTPEHPGPMILRDPVNGPGSTVDDDPDVRSARIAAGWDAVPDQADSRPAERGSDRAPTWPHRAVDAAPEPAAMLAAPDGPSLEDKIGELEAMMAQAEGAWLREAGPQRAKTPAGQQQEEPRGPVEAEVEAPTDDTMALRSLVAELVREELRGAVGEDIALNVRKLVRSEIRRVLSDAEFD